MTNELQQIGRVALRQEGNNWNAYYAQTDTMDGAIFLGSLSMQFAVLPKHKQAFIELMRSVVGSIIHDATGLTPEWKSPHRAPERERSGHS